MQILLKKLWLLPLLIIGLCHAAPQTLGDLAVNLTNELPPYSTMISGFAYIMGVAFTIGGALKMKHHKESPQGTTAMGGPLYVVMGILLTYLPTTISYLASSVFTSDDLETGMGLYYTKKLMDGVSTENPLA